MTQTIVPTTATTALQWQRSFRTLSHMRQNKNSVPIRDMLSLKKILSARRSLLQNTGESRCRHSPLVLISAFNLTIKVAPILPSLNSSGLRSSSSLQTATANAMLCWRQRPRGWMSSRKESGTRQIRCLVTGTTLVGEIYLFVYPVCVQS